MPLYLAIDAGGTKAEYLLSDGARSLAHAFSPTIKRMRTSAEECEANLSAGLAQIAATSSLSLRDVTCTCIGTSGVTVPLVADWLRQQFAQRVGGQLLLLGDVEIALDAAFPGASGTLVLAGTGSNVAGRSTSGQLFGAGGHGPVLADQGSGHLIGHMATRAAFLALDEGRDTALMPAILRHWSLSTVDDLVAYGNTCHPSEFSTLTPLVLACAQQGDSVAAEVLAQQGRDLAHLALLVHARIAAADGSVSQPRFAFAGSVLTHVHPVREALIASVRARLPAATFVPQPVEPVLGALWRARHATP